MYTTRTAKRTTQSREIDHTSSHREASFTFWYGEGAGMAADERRLVYSTDGSLPVPELRRARSSGKPQAGPPDDGTLRVGCEKRRGGTLTLLYGLGPSEVDTVAAALKRRCATGGTVKGGVVSLQGDRREAVIAYFTEQKRRVKKMGG